MVHCQLHKVATKQLPILKRAVAATNEAFKRNAQKEAVVLEQREEVWREERQVVEAMAASLRFE